MRLPTRFPLSKMKYSRVASTDVYLSAVGFGSCQLRLVSERQALKTLKRGFRLGVNWVHAAPDYDGIQNLVARAIREHGKDIIMLSQGYGDMAHFEYLFENTCRILGKKHLKMFGIACIDDREYLGEDVWGSHGMVRFLEKKKADGRLDGIFCTTHGTAEYISGLITSGRFDAVMMAYNLLGFHLLSYCPTDHKKIENIDENKRAIFPLALKKGVSLLIMKPLAGGLVSKSKAFPPCHAFALPSKPISATRQLQAILANPAVTAVVPGTASVEEADENARAGHVPDVRHSGNSPIHEISKALETLKSGLCRRCGVCEPYCSKNLPISWLFRDAYVSNYPSEPFETTDDLRYFNLHPWSVSKCLTCDERTCHCPHGIDIPDALIRVHERMLRLRSLNRIVPKAVSPEILIQGGLSVQIISREIPQAIRAGEAETCRVFLMNKGDHIWLSPFESEKGDFVFLSVTMDGKSFKSVPLRRNVPPGDRTYVVFELRAPYRCGRYDLRVELIKGKEAALPDDRMLLLESKLHVFGNGMFSNIASQIFSRGKGVRS